MHKLFDVKVAQNFHNKYEAALLSGIEAAVDAVANARKFQEWIYGCWREGHLTVGQRKRSHERLYGQFVQQSWLVAE
jgi:hypothetical protein